jgi:PAS domain S-box-containing protein
MSESEQQSTAELRGAGLLVILGPLLALGAFTALLAGVATLIGWHSEEMLVIALIAGAAAVAMSAFLYYRVLRERQEARRAVQDAHARVQGIVDSAMDAIITTDQGQRIVLFNTAAEEVFRWPRSAVLGQPLEMLLPERLRGQHRRHVERFGETGVTSRRMGDRTVLVGVRASGEEFPLEASISQHSESGRKLYTVILRDITERTRAEELRAKSEARLRGILDSAMDAIITVDDSQKILLFNKAAENVFDCPRNEAIGAPLAWFIPERFRADHEKHLVRFGEAGVTSRRMGAQRIVTGLRRNGEEFPVDASISQITEDGRKYFTVILRDVTERVRAEDALRRSREELRELAAASNSVREQEKSRIARELHDELGQALTALKMDVEWLRERMTQDEQATEDKLSAMHGLLDSTVAATRRISADLRPLMLDDLGLLPAVEWLIQNFRQRTGIACQFSLGNPDLELDDPYATAIFRILQESLTNVSRHAQASLVEVTLDAHEDEVLLTVRDNGVGFSKDAPQKPKSYGLMGVAERAYLLGGNVKIDSERNRGTTIEVRIPIGQSLEQA